MKGQTGKNEEQLEKMKDKKHRGRKKGFKSGIMTHSLVL